MAVWLAMMGGAPVLATSYYVTVAGLGGEPDYEQRFAAWASDLDKVFSEGGADVRVQTLHGPEATRERVRGVLEEIARQSGAGDALALIIIGHGTFDGHEYKINLPGPDVSAEELAAVDEIVPPGTT